MKQIKFIGSSLDDLRDFPQEVRAQCGFELRRVQNGLMPTDFKPMPSIGKGVYEIRLHELGEFRVIYIAKYKNFVYVLHGFQKKTQATRKEDIDLAIKRHKTIGEYAMKITDPDLTITKSSGNVFTDLGFNDAEATILAMRSQLMCDIAKQIDKHHWTQSDAAEHLGISQARVSDLVRGKFAKFSLDMLIQLATRAGHSVRIELAEIV
jgi:phage-related protein/predicted XRE-type DNA-binding protein